MRRQAGHALDLLGPFLLEVQEDLLATIRKKYGDKAIGWSNEEDEISGLRFPRLPCPLSGFQMITR